MTRHYTHTREAAALAAVSALPAFTGHPIKALPPAPSPRMVEAEAVVKITQRLNGRNWRTIQAELLTLAAGGS